MVAWLAMSTVSGAYGADLFPSPLPAVDPPGAYLHRGEVNDWAAHEDHLAEQAGRRVATGAVLGLLEDPHRDGSREIVELRPPPARGPGPEILAILAAKGRATPPGASVRETRMRTSLVAGGVAVGLFAGGALLAAGAQERPFTDSRALIVANNSLLVGSALAAGAAAGLFTWSLTTP